jgi:hypothetical protein
MKKKQVKVRIIRLLRTTSGGRHAWYEAEITDEKGSAIVEIRKQIA